MQWVVAALRLQARYFLLGFVSVPHAREILIRKAVVNGRRWRSFMIICICLAFSVFYELIESWVALASGEDAEAFASTQGYVWDTQSDMWLALVGAITSLLILAIPRDKQ